MKKNLTLILAITIGIVIIALIFINTRTTSSKKSNSDNTSAVSSPEITTPEETNSVTTDEISPAPVSEKISEVHISGTEFETMHILLAEEQNEIITSYTLTTDTLNKIALNLNSFDQLINSIPSPVAEEVLAENVTDLSAYGLDVPRLHLVINFYDSNETTEIISDGLTTSLPITSTLDFMWGNSLENGKVAFMKTGDTNVYTMDGSFIESLQLVATPFNLSSKFIALPNIQDVKTIDITFPDSHYQVTVDHAAETYSINNKSADIDTFKPIYRSIIGIYGELLLDEISSDSAPVITITYTLNDGSIKEALFTNATDSQYYQSTLNGSMIVGCSKSQLTTLKTTLDEFLSENA